MLISASLGLLLNSDTNEPSYEKVRKKEQGQGADSYAMQKDAVVHAGRCGYAAYDSTVRSLRI